MPKTPEVTVRDTRYAVQTGTVSPRRVSDAPGGYWLARCEGRVTLASPPVLRVQSVSQLFHGPAPRSPLHRLAVRLRHSRSNTSTEYSLPGATQLSQVSTGSLFPRGARRAEGGAVTDTKALAEPLYRSSGADAKTTSVTVLTFTKPATRRLPSCIIHMNTPGYLGHTHLEKILANKSVLTC